MIPRLIFPKVNDYCPSETGYKEELAELKKTWYRN